MGSSGRGGGGKEEWDGGSNNYKGWQQSSSRALGSFAPDGGGRNWHIITFPSQLKGKQETVPK